MGRKRSGRQTANRKRNHETSLDAADINAQIDQQALLITQLTQQLNDANQRLEQIDTGIRNDQSRNEDSARVLECLTTLLAAHEELQPRRTLQRIEDKIDDLRDRTAATPDTIAAKPATAETVSPEKELTWEEIRANAISGVKPAVKIEREADNLQDQPTSLSGLLPPDPIDVDEADVQQLREAVERRDAYAVCLLHQMRVIERRKLITADELAQMAHAPAEMQAAITELEARLQEVLRMTEVELSMERARVSREAVRVEHQQHLLAQQESRLNEQREAMQIPVPSPEKSNRKWLDALGFGKD